MKLPYTMYPRIKYDYRLFDNRKQYQRGQSNIIFLEKSFVKRMKDSKLWSVGITLQKEP